MMLAVDTGIIDKIRPPRSAFYDGEFGSVAGKPNWKQHQLRILDESLRWIETFDQPASRKLVCQTRNRSRRRTRRKVNQLKIKLKLKIKKDGKLFIPSFLMRGLPLF